jgi:hypothetical protein
VSRAGHCGKAAIAARLFFFKNAWHIKDIFREFEAFLKILILFLKKFSEKLRLFFLINVRVFKDCEYF